MINHCPQIGCNGKLRKSIVGGPNKRISGYKGDSQPCYRCKKCQLRFIITNPNSFKDITNEK